MRLGIGLSILLQSLLYALFGLESILIFNVIGIIIFFFLLGYDYIVWDLGLIRKKTQRGGWTKSKKHKLIS